MSIARRLGFHLLAVIVTIGVMPALDIGKAAAQENGPTEKEAALAACLAVGDYVRIINRDHGRTDGQIRSVTADGVEVEREGQSTAQPFDEILVVMRRGNKAGTGALVGGVTFGLLGMLVGASYADVWGTADSGEKAGGAIVGGLAGAAIGAGIGALIGMSVTSWKRVCR